MDDQITKKIKDDLKRLISQARKENKWIHCKYQDLWFAPDELEKTNMAGVCFERSYNECR